MGYAAPIDGIDVLNSNTPGVIDPSNPVPGSFFQVVADLDRFGRFHFTETTAYSGNNGRAAILNNDAGAFYTGGNARPASAGRGAADEPSGLRPLDADDDGAAEQHVHPQGLPDDAGQVDHVVPVRFLVRERPHSSCRRRADS
jgi:hypothetical protein